MFGGRKNRKSSKNRKSAKNRKSSKRIGRSRSRSGGDYKPCVGWCQSGEKVIVK